MMYVCKHFLSFPILLLAMSLSLGVLAESSSEEEDVRPMECLSSSEKTQTVYTQVAKTKKVKSSKLSKRKKSKQKRAKKNKNKAKKNLKQAQKINNSKRKKRKLKQAKKSLKNSNKNLKKANKMSTKVNKRYMATQDSIGKEEAKEANNFSCNDFDPSLATTFTDVCVFKSGSWQLGDMVYDANTGEHEFVTNISCDFGITVYRGNPSIQDIESPSIKDFMRKGDKKLVTLSSGNYHSKLEESTLEEDFEKPISCYTEVTGGVALNPLPCADHPNEVGYCQFKKLPKPKVKNSPGTNSYSGGWWIRYSGANQAKFSVCTGGVKTSNLRKIASQLPKNQKIISVKKMPVSKVREKFQSAMDSESEDISIGHKLAACYSGEHRIACRNERSDAGFENWQEDKKAFIAERRNQLIKDNEAKINRLKNKMKKRYSKSKRMAAREQYDTLMMDIEEKTDDIVEEDAARMGGYLVNKTPERSGSCYFSWNPESKKLTKAYVFEGIRKRIKSKRGKFHHQTVMKKVGCNFFDVVREKKVSSLAQK